MTRLHPSPFVLEHLGLAPPGAGLDVACGAGGHALASARTSGRRVDAIDRDRDRCTRLASTARQEGLPIRVVCADLERMPLPVARYAVVVNTLYLDRGLVPALKAALRPGGLLVFETFAVEQLGLVKIDLLSLRTLGVVSDALDRIERDTGHRPDLDSLPHDDPEVFATIRSADTVGMFQIESRAQMQALPKARPERFEDLVVQVAIIRPGPIQGNAVHPYLRRRAGAEEVTYLHPSLEPILSDTLGVILYQEQVMQIAIDVCGYSPLEADIFRKAMGSHRSHREMEKEHARFVSGARRTGLTPRRSSRSAPPSLSSASPVPTPRPSPRSPTTPPG